MCLSAVEKRQKLLAGFGTGSHAAKHTACCGCAGGLLDTAHHHAEMRRLHDHADTSGIQHLLDGQGDLFRETFLYLQAAGKHFGQTG